MMWITYLYYFSIRYCFIKSMSWWFFTRIVVNGIRIAECSIKSQKCLLCTMHLIRFQNHKSIFLCYVCSKSTCFEGSHYVTCSCCFGKFSSVVWFFCLGILLLEMFKKLSMIIQCRFDCRNSRMKGKNHSFIYFVSL